MPLSDGYTDIAAGKVAAIVTHLEMRERPSNLDLSPSGDWRLRHVSQPNPEWYKSLYRAIGQDWLWFSRLEYTDGQLTSTICHPRVEIYAFEVAGKDEGLLELDFRNDGECELAFFGVAAHCQGKGAGRWLMNRATDLAWARPIERFRVHTCTFDHHGALSFYVRSGFVPYRRQLEIAPDPRLTGVMPRSAAPQTPIIE